MAYASTAYGPLCTCAEADKLSPNMHVGTLHSVLAGAWKSLQQAKSPAQLAADLESLRKGRTCLCVAGACCDIVEGPAAVCRGCHKVVAGRMHCHRCYRVGVVLHQQTSNDFGERYCLLQLCEGARALGDRQICKNEVSKTAYYSLQTCNIPSQKGQPKSPGGG